jgi:hypothetical protein
MTVEHRFHCVLVSSEAKGMNTEEYKRQCGRIQRLVAELSPGATVEFDENRAPISVKFSIRNGMTILDVSGDEPLANVRDWSQQTAHQIRSRNLQ